ncbi:hypothetical protein PG997_001682 [Apiospora hydei]|uniref:Uncharacterized protein n=1 Tax=Apiospora hydei TaxID=1337664 RepID=A0ABR1XEK4_9PEZI
MSGFPKETAHRGNKKRRLGADAVDEPETLSDGSGVDKIKLLAEQNVNMGSLLMMSGNKVHYIYSVQEKRMADQEAAIHEIIKVIKSGKGTTPDVARRLDEVDAKINGIKSEQDDDAQVPDDIKRSQDNTLDIKTDMNRQFEMEHKEQLEKLGQQLAESHAKISRLKAELDGNRSTHQGPSTY